MHYKRKKRNIFIHEYLSSAVLDFYLILRIGELKGLRWDDISGDYLHIQRFVNDKNEIVEDILENRLNHAFSTGQILDALRNYTCTHLDTNMWKFTYYDEVIDACAKAWGGASQ